MTLPKNTIPTYTTKLPLSNKEVKFRPFIVKEEKAIMIALQDNSSMTIYDTIKSVLLSCTYNAVDVDSLPLSDLEYLFLQLRIKSKGSLVDVAFKCDHEKEDKTVCGNITEFQIDLNDITIDSSSVPSRKIMLNENESFGVILKYPTLSSMQFIEDLFVSEDVTKIYSVFSKFIDTIFKGEDLYDTKDYSEADLIDWIESLTDSQFEKIKNFFGELPKLKYTQKVKCSSCGHEEEIEMTGLKSFLE